MIKLADLDVLGMTDGAVTETFHWLVRSHALWACGCPRVFLRQAHDRRPLRRTVRVRLGPNTLWLLGCTPIFAVSRRQFMNYPG